MELTQATKIADQVCQVLKEYCQPDRIIVAGSIRRKRPIVHDIDLVLLPSDPWGLNQALKKLGTVMALGPAISRAKLANGAGLDIYFANADTWATLLLIRTGSKEHNIFLCSRAKNMGMKLHANGTGLFKVEGSNEIRIAGDTEASIFAALNLPYIEPEKRERLQISQTYLSVVHPLSPRQLTSLYLPTGANSSISGIKSRTRRQSKRRPR